MHAADDSSYHRTIIIKNQGTIFFDEWSYVRRENERN